MRLKRMLIADPVVNVAELMARQCKRLAEEQVITTSTQAAHSALEQQTFDMAVVSLELGHINPEKFYQALKKNNGDIFVVATFRELAVFQMERLGSLGYDELMPQPLDMTDLFRLASRRFNLPFRRHQRFDVTLPIRRADGAEMGETINLSEGGLAMTVKLPVQSGTSVLMELMLPDGPLRTRFEVLYVASEGDTATVRGQFGNLRGAEHRRLSEYLAQLGDERASNLSTEQIVARR